MSAAPPSQTSSSLSFRAWDVAYAGLAAQFDAVSWDTSVNFWDRVYDFSPPESGAPRSFTVQTDEAHAATRWSQLVLAPSGLCGGSVVETSGPELPTPDCKASRCIPTAASPAHVTVPVPVSSDPTRNADGPYRLEERPKAPSEPAATAGVTAAPPPFSQWLSKCTGAINQLICAALRLVGVGADSAGPSDASGPNGAPTKCAVQ